MKDKKHKGIINIYTSIVFDYRNAEIRICTDGGRLSRPVLRVRDNKLLITKDIVDKLAKNGVYWNDLLMSAVLKESVIEYIDPDEQNVSLIAMTPDEMRENPRKSIHIMKSILVPFSVYWLLVPFLITIRLLAIHIRPQWRNRQWVYIL